MFWERELEAAFAALRAGKLPGDVETARLDFKQQGRSKDDLLREVAQAVVCFANSDGGQVVVGIPNRPDAPEARWGTDLAPDEVSQRVYALSRPPLAVEVAEVEFQGARLLVVRVPRSAEIHSDPQGRAPRRVGTECVAMDPIDQQLLREERRGVDWSAAPSDRDPTEVSPFALAQARERLGRQVDDRRQLARLADADLLRALGALGADGRLTRAGEVLFCDPAPAAADTVVYQFRATPGGEPRAERIRAPMLTAFERTLQLVRDRSAPPRPVPLPNGQLLAIEDFPELAVREAVANALLHRDYQRAAPVDVEHSPNVLAISSPGPLVGGVRPDNILTHPSKPRNPLLTRAARTLGMAEEVGRGVDRMFREMIRSGRDAPLIESHVDRVRVSFVSDAPNAPITRLVAQLPESERDDTDTLLVLLTLRRRALVSAPQIAPTLQKPVEEAEAVLRRLAQDAVGLIEPSRATARRAHPSYRLRAEVLQVLGSAVAYHRRDGDVLDRKMLAHLDEYEFITNRTVQNLFDVSVQRARDLLQDWVRRGFLVKISVHGRGPGVRYGRGPAVPR